MEEKTCSKCFLNKPVTDYSVADKRGNRRSWCRLCESVRVRAYYASNETYRQKTKDRVRKWEINNPERRAVVQAKASRKYKFGITDEQYQSMIIAQGSCCALCGSQDHGRSGNGRRSTGKRKWVAKNWNIDHSHKTGVVRGLLCHTCNVRLGAYEFLMEQIGPEKVSAYLARGLSDAHLPQGSDTPA